MYFIMNPFAFVGHAFKVLATFAHDVSPPVPSQATMTGQSGNYLSWRH